MVAQTAAVGVAVPPEPDGLHGRRRVGVEIEFGGLDAAHVADLVREHYGGTVVESAANIYDVHGTRFGTFRVKIDWSLAQFADAQTMQRAAEGDILAKVTVGLAHTVADLGAVVMPYEVAAPPMPFHQLPVLDKLVASMRAEGAEDTRSHWLHAYALQLNPEVPSLAAGDILRLLRAYVLMSDWLRQQIQVDFTRRISTFVEPFPAAYVRAILARGYVPTVGELIDDYIAANPTRNRELDLLPLFKHLDESRVREQLDDRLIHARPTYHYRLPDCRLSDPDWGVVVEWNRWVEVERLAADEERLQSLAARFLQQPEAQQEHWPAIVARSAG
jgi:hypothetical protein